MNFYHLSNFVVALSLSIATSGHAQTVIKPTPTIKVLAIGTIAPGVDNKMVYAILRKEVVETTHLYLGGKIDQWYSQQDRPGVVFIMNVTDPTKARKMLEALPLGRAHLMSFKLIRLAPLAPLRLLEATTTKP